MPRTYKQKGKSCRYTPPKLPNQSPIPSTIPNQSQSSGILGSILQGFSFGSGAQVAKEIFSSDSKSPEISSTTTPEYCNILRNNLEECNQSGMYDCQYLTTLLENKCNNELLFTMNNK